jgi:hypothetical protein
MRSVTAKSASSAVCTGQRNCGGELLRVLRRANALSDAAEDTARATALGSAAPRYFSALPRTGYFFGFILR